MKGKDRHGGEDNEYKDPEARSRDKMKASLASVGRTGRLVGDNN